MKHLLLTIAALVLVGCGIHNDALIQAIKEGNIEAVKQHTSGILRGDVNAKDKLGVTPLFYAAFKGDREITEILITAGADVNAKNVDSRTPLHKAASLSFTEVAKLLIAKGADVNAKTDNGWTPLHYAVSLVYMEVAKLLIAKGADVNAKNDAGETPLDWAIKSDDEDYINLLRKHGGKTGEEFKAEGK